MADAQVAEKNKLKSKGEIRLQYPLDLEENYPHRVDFTIYVPQKSEFRKDVVSENTLSNYGPLGGDVFKSATSLAQNVFAAQGAVQIGKDAALAAATATTAIGGGGGGGVISQVVRGVAKVAAGATAATAGAVASVATNSKTQAAAKGVFATELIKRSTSVTGLQIQRNASRIALMISMYMPGNFFTTYGHDYDQISVKEAGGMLGMLGAGGEALQGFLGNKGFTDASSAIKNPGDFMKALASFPGKSNPYTALAAGAIGSSTQTPIIGGNLVGSGFTDVALFNMGYAQNPMLEVLYRGTNFRSFQFEFMFQPKSADEARQVREIIKQFKFHAAPETNPTVNPEGGTAQGGTSMPMFFVPPSEFEINLRHETEQNPYLPKIGRCVLSRIDVDYSPGGQWQTYADGNPVETRLRLEFTEVELVTKKKIEEDGF